MSTNQERAAFEAKPCPFCGESGVTVQHGSTSRWRYAICDSCGAQAGEVRVQTLGAGTKEQWEAKAHADAIEEWNRRASAKSEPAESLVTALLAFAPNFGNETNEPSLSALIYRYYRAYFEHEEADRYARKWISAFTEFAQHRSTPAEQPDDGINESLAHWPFETAAEAAAFDAADESAPDERLALKPLTQPAESGAVRLPPLPPKEVVDRHLPTGVCIYGYSAEQMQAYARQAIEQAGSEAKPAEPLAWMWQHPETGLTGFVEHASEEELRHWERMNKPRKIVAPLYARAPVLHLGAMNVSAPDTQGRSHTARPDDPESDSGQEQEEGKA